MESMGEGRGDEAADYVMKFSSKGHTYDDETRQAFRKDMKELFDRVCRGYGYDVDIGVTLRGILHLIRVHHITIEANYATLVMNVLCLDSMARALLPTYNILDGGKPLLRYNRSTKHLPGSSVVTKAAIPAAQCE
jgi:aarF domain-containing kinase